MDALQAGAAARRSSRRPPTSATSKGCDLIIEAVFENRELKAKVTRRPSRCSRPAACSRATPRPCRSAAWPRPARAPERFVGLHFFSPVRQDEAGRDHPRQADRATRRSRAPTTTCIAIGKTPIVVNDSRGFFTSRVFGTFVMEGAAMLAEGMPAPLIEHAGARGRHAGRAAGGARRDLAVALGARAWTRPAPTSPPRASRYEPVAGERLVERMVKELEAPGPRRRRRLLRLSRRASRSALWPELKTHVREARRARRTSPSSTQRLLYRQAIETARCLAEGVLTSAHDANIGSIFGIGFPAWTGGAMQFIASEGVRALRRQRRRPRGALRRALRARSPRGARLHRAARSLRPRSSAAWLLRVRIHCTSCLASASLTCGLAGIGTAPQTPEPPLITFCDELVDGVLLAGVLGGDVLVGRADDLLVDGVAGHAVLLLRQLGVGPRRARRAMQAITIATRALRFMRFLGGPDDDPLGYHQHNGDAARALTGRGCRRARAPAGDRHAVRPRRRSC